MHILFLDFLYSRGHKKINTNLISILSKIAFVTVLSEKGFYTECQKKIINTKFVEKIFFKLNIKNQIISRLRSLIIIIKSANFSKKIKSNYIVISSFETITFITVLLLFKSLNKVYIVHHNNLDELKDNTKLKIFKIYMKSVNHIVLDDFIKDFLLKELEVEGNRIHCMPHPIDNVDLVNKFENKYFCVGLSNSNDENFIKELIEYERQTESIKKSGRKIILKSDYLTFDNKYLKVFKGFLEKQTYEDYLLNCEYVLIPFSKSFRFRVSGTLMDAIAYKKMVIGSNIPLINFYSFKYPNFCKKINGLEDFFKIINSCYTVNKIELSKELNELHLKHSEENLINIFTNIFSGEKFNEDNN